MLYCNFIRLRLDFKKMSYILDAIKKAESEKYPPITPQPKTPLWLWLGIIIFMNILCFMLLLWPKEPIAPPQIYIIDPHSLIQDSDK